jgi:ABC-type nitrate/sulfonate/bicarbonate transport system substrate-binding protein
VLFKQKQLDAVWTVEPWVSRLQLEARARVLVEESDAITTVLAAGCPTAQFAAPITGRGKLRQQIFGISTSDRI